MLSISALMLTEAVFRNNRPAIVTFQVVDLTASAAFVTLDFPECVRSGLVVVGVVAEFSATVAFPANVMN